MERSQKCVLKWSGKGFTKGHPLGGEAAVRGLSTKRGEDAEEEADLSWVLGKAEQTRLWTALQPQGPRFHGLWGLFNSWVSQENLLEWIFGEPEYQGMGEKGVAF